jgi:hypothetical protein
MAEISTIEANRQALNDSVGSRTFVVSPELISLCRPLGEGTRDEGWALQASCMLPRNLSVTEVDHLGFQFAQDAVGSGASRYDALKGHRAERRILNSLGCVAIVLGDHNTAESIIQHLWRQSREHLSIGSLATSVGLRYALHVARRDNKT